MVSSPGAAEKEPLLGAARREAWSRHPLPAEQSYLKSPSGRARWHLGPSMSPCELAPGTKGPTEHLLVLDVTLHPEIKATRRGRAIIQLGDPTASPADVR